MSTYTFKVIVTASDRIFSLKFSPEGNDDLSILWHRTNGFKTFTSDPFTVDVQGDFDYKLVIGAKTTVEYTYTIQVKSGSTWRKVKEETRTIQQKNSDTVVDSITL